ncbi:alpha-galactosidase [Virgisporangium aliadipatigenens]|uniref:alpha-galactosidase n=1 Tax=Virgisporangium aliadipatigenens TaxID=741659 RepID=A0A8J3YMN1_9ACTN|nr:alpha-galactosidase [Virgisporangium aliadipatigenens]GIJ46665.1 alpha-galactosidase [Virgisporangium aliadipatigenens]
MLIQLRSAGTGLVLDARGPHPPAIVHFGRDLGDVDPVSLVDALVPAVPPSAMDLPLRLSLLAGPDQGWTGRPAVGGASAWRLALVSRPSPVSVTTESRSGPLVLHTSIELTAQGLLRLRHRLTNTGDAPFTPSTVDMLLPVPDRARELMDFSGVWSYERRPQRMPLRDGVWLRETRHGRPGHDDPYLMMLGTPGFGFDSGEIWAVHLAWSGDKRVFAERSPLGRAVLGCGELLGPGEIVLGPGESYESPWAVAGWSDSGIDGLSARFHAEIRAVKRPIPRPVVLNTWEAVYFDQSMERLRPLVDAAAEVGVERFVLDDGWFTGRTDDRRALGDWTVDPERWPDGLHPLVNAVRERGMEFGLWVEPEMVSPDSALARAHPDWLLGPPDALTWRHQRVLDLAEPGAWQYVLDSLNALLSEYPIAYLKWDQNRDLLLEGVSHRQTTALYRLLAALRARHPHVEIESCASGGARVDLGILEHVDRFWTSDTNDPLERQRIQRWTGVLVPPEYLGAHVGAPTAHITGRRTDLGFRLATALFGGAGIEWDLTTADDSDRRAVAAWVALYKELRPLLHTGTVVRTALPGGDDPERLLHGVVAADRTQAVYAYVTMRASASALPAPIRFPGLDPDRTYTVRPLAVGAAPRTVQAAPPGWVERGDVTLPGRVLAEVGIAAPLLTPERALVLRVCAVA